SVEEGIAQEEGPCLPGPRRQSKGDVNPGVNEPAQHNEGASAELVHGPAQNEVARALDDVKGTPPHRQQSRWHTELTCPQQQEGVGRVAKGKNRQGKEVEAKVPVERLEGQMQASLQRLGSWCFAQAED